MQIQLSTIGMSMREYSVVWSGADYVRCSWVGGSWLHEGDVRDNANMLAMALTGIRNPQLRASEWRLGGYKGVAYPGCAWGIRTNGALMMQASGANAIDAVQRFVSPDRVSRLDLQVTVQCPSSVSRETLEGHYGELRAAYDRPKGKGRRAVPGRIEQERLTVSSGKRGRQGIYVRIYDSDFVHGKEAEAYKDTIRFEAEITGSAAIEAYKQCQFAEWSGSEVAGIVEDIVNRRGCDVRFTGASGYMPVVPREANKDIDRTVQWLIKSVKPSLARLKAQGVDTGVLLELLKPD